MLSKENEPINIGNPQEMTIEQIARLIIEMTGSKSTDRLQAVADRRPEGQAAGHHPRADAARLGAEGSARAWPRPHDRLLQGKGPGFVVAVRHARSRLEALAGPQGKGIRRADADPGEGHPHDPVRTRRHRRRANRHRQDRGIRAAAARTTRRRSGRAHHARAGDRADPRAGRADRRERARLRQAPAAALRDDLRRRGRRPADPGAAARASISSSPPRAA